MLFLADQRAHVRGRIERRARRPERRGRRHAFEHAVKHRLVRKQTRSRDADLARIEKDRARSAGGNLCHIDIGQDHHRRFSAQFERHALHRFGGIAVDHFADLGRSGEGDLVDIGMLDQSVARDMAEPGNHVDHARRKARLDNQIGQPQRGDRRLFGGFEHQRTARRERRSNLQRGHQQREIPRHDLAADADRFLDGIAEHRARRHRIGRGGFARDFTRPAGHEAQLADRAGNVDGARHGLGLAVVDRFEFGKFVGMRFEQVGEPVDDPFAGHRRQARPAPVVKGGARSGNCAVDIGGGRIDHMRHDPSGRGVFDFDQRTMARIDPLVVDEQLRLARQCLGRSGRIGGLDIADGGDVVHRSSSFRLRPRLVRDT